MKVYNIFPLTICQSKIDIEDKEKSNLISLIKEMKASSKNIDYYNKLDLGQEIPKDLKIYIIIQNLIIYLVKLKKN